MRKKVYGMLVGANSLYLSEPDGRYHAFGQWEPSVPGSPFYHQVWEPENASWYQELRSRLGVGAFTKPSVMLALPEDAVEVDKRALTEFMLQAGCDAVAPKRQGALFQNFAKEYIVVSATGRAGIVSLYRDSERVRVRYFEREAFRRSAVESALSAWQAERPTALPCFIIDLDGQLDELNGLGTVYRQTDMENLLDEAKEREKQL